MNRKTLITRAAGAVIASGALVLAAAGPAAAHNLHVDPPGGSGKHGWVGGPLLDQAKGRGLIPGGPEGLNLLAPSHDGGLVAACLALTANGNDTVSILGPTAPHLTPTCRHGSQPVG